MRYTGQRQEAGARVLTGIGLYFYGARWYDAAPEYWRGLGRFVSPDSMIPAQQGVMGNDRYAYTNNNPLSFTDPTGHWYYDPGCDCLVDTEESYNEHPEYLDYVPIKHPIGFENTEYFVERGSAGLIGGLNYSISPPLGEFKTGGVESIYLFNDRTIAIYNFMGEGVTYGAGASATLYGGLVFDIDKPEDYTGQANSCGVTISVLGKGISLDYFWPAGEDPLSPDGPHGFTLGWSPGAQAASWCTTTLYTLQWFSTSHRR